MSVRLLELEELLDEAKQELEALGEVTTVEKHLVRKRVLKLQRMVESRKQYDAAEKR